MRQRKSRRNSISIVELGIDFLESFRKIANWSNDTLLDYMNKTNNWDILNDESLIRGLIGSDIEDCVEIFGRYLSEDEQANIISRYYSRLQQGGLEVCKRK